jgi:hypothetical protein
LDKKGREPFSSSKAPAPLFSAGDNNGNTTTNQAGTTLVYDVWNRLVEVKQGLTPIQFALFFFRFLLTVTAFAGMRCRREGGIGKADRNIRLPSLWNRNRGGGKANACARSGGLSGRTT